MRYPAISEHWRGSAWPSSHPAVAGRQVPGADRRGANRCRHRDWSSPMIAAASPAGRIDQAAGRLPSLPRQALVRGLVEIKLFFRQRESVVFTFALPMILLVLFGQIFHGTIGNTGVSFKQYFISGIIASGLMATTFVNLGVSIAADRDDGSLTRLSGTPLSPVGYFAGKAILAFVVALLEVIGLLALGVGLLGLHLPTSPGRWLTLAWVLLLGAATCSLL